MSFVDKSMSIDHNIGEFETQRQEKWSWEVDNHYLGRLWYQLMGSLHAIDYWS